MSNINISCNNAAYRRTATSAVVMHARALTGARVFTGTDFAAVKPATAKGHRTWSPPNT